MIRLSFAPWQVALALLSAGLALGADAPAAPRTDLLGDPLPAGAVARMGSGRLRHGGHLYGLAFSPDGKSLVSGGDRGLRVWDTATGKLRRRLAVEADGGFAFAVTADGIAVAEPASKTRPVTVQVIDPASGKVVRRTELPGQTTSSYMTFSPDGKRLACTPKDALWVYDAATGREALRIPPGAGRWARDVAFAPDGKSLAACDLSDTVRLYETGNGKPLRALQRRGDKVFCVRFSPDGRWLASLPYYNRNEQPGGCSVWDVAAGKERHRLKAPAGFVVCAAFSPDGKYLATGGLHRELVLWDVASGKEVRRLPTAGYFFNIAFSPDGKTVAAAEGGRGTIRMWEVATGRVLPGSADPALDTVSHLHFSADGRRLFGCAAMPIAWQPLTGREAHRYPAPPLSSRRCWLSPDETLIASADGPDIRLSDARTGKELRVLKGHEKGTVWVLAFVSGGRLASSGSDGTVRVWDMASGRQLHKVIGGGGATPRLAAAPDGRRLAIAGDLPGPGGEYEVVLWDLAAGRERTRLPLGRENGARQVAFSPDGRFLAAALGYDSGWGGPGPIKVWEAATGKEWRCLEDHPTWVVSMTFSPDGRALATGGYDGSLYLWELASGRRRHAFAGHETSVDSLAFSPDGRTLASSSEAPVYVWDVTGAYAPRRPAPTTAELGRCWDELAGADAEAAFRAVRHLAGAPATAVPFLRGRLRPVPAVPPGRVRRLLADLDGADFAARRRAAAELEELADVAATELRKALERATSAEVRRALKHTLDGLVTPTPERLRALRAVEALEWAGTPEAARLLDELARGAPGATLTEEAAAARDRLRKRAGQRKEGGR